MTAPTVSISLALPLTGQGPQGIPDFFAAPSVTVSDTGIQIIVAVVDGLGNAVDISDASVTSFIIGYPDEAAILSTAASFVTDGTDGLLTYTTLQADLWEDGIYSIQAEMTIGAATYQTIPGCFWAYQNVVGSSQPPPPSTFTSSAVIFFDGSGTRWAMMVTPVTGALFTKAQASGPANFLQFNNLVMQDADGVYWTVTMQTTGQYLATPGGTFPNALANLIMNDSTGASWVVTISTAGVLTPA